MLTPAEIVIVKVAEAVFCAESVTVMPKVGVPVVVGVPLSPPAAESVSPAGNAEPPLTAQLYPLPDPPVAAMVTE